MNHVCVFMNHVCACMNHACVCMNPVCAYVNVVCAFIFIETLLAPYIYVDVRSQVYARCAHATLWPSMRP